MSSLTLTLSPGFLPTMILEAVTALSLVRLLRLGLDQVNVFGFGHGGAYDRLDIKSKSSQFHPKLSVHYL